jgi:transcriptional regulator NrdR family protein
MCEHKRTKVVDSRKEDVVRRRRRCFGCGESFTTYEVSGEEILKLRKALRTLNAIRTAVKTIPDISFI